MNALVHAPARPSDRVLMPMNVGCLAQVLQIEMAAYDFPWTHGNFVDSLHAGYPAHVLRDAATDEMLGYFVAMRGVEEMHLLNITVAPSHQRQGHALHMLELLREMARREGAMRLWLEVRQSNERARTIYEQFGFTAQGLRRGYYPAAGRQREDAVVMGMTP